jgi:hypothetical protein
MSRKKTSPFYCYKKMCRKTAWDTPEYMTEQDWGTKSGKPSTQGPKATGERYLPKKAIQSLTSKEYAATTKAKRAGTAAGKQFVRQPKAIARKTTEYI